MPSTERSMAASQRGGSPAGTYRPYLDGLRAIAVGGVVVYHLNRSWLPGGYLGVDLFFVLSGYLITTLLIVEHRSTGRIDLPGFWSRRVRRLLPALLFLLVVLSIEMALRGDELAAASARGDFLATLFYAANWHFILTDQSYFAQYVAASPVRHAWSLAIEEQFYIAWPLLAGLLLGRGGLRALAPAALLLSVASVIAMWLLFDPAADPSRAYFGTDARIYQILIGALLAAILLSPWRARVLAVARPLAIPALLAIAAAMVFLADDSALYYRGAAPAFVVAAVILIAGLEAGSSLTSLLSLRPVVVIGLVSYGVYLWHFPITLFVARTIGPTSDLLPAAVVLAATAAFVAFSYVVIERPIRRGRALAGFALTPRRLALVVPVASAVVAGSILISTGGAVTPAWASADSGSGPSAGPTASLRPSAWTVGVVGDSVMVSAMPGLEDAAGARGWRLVDAAIAGCPVGYEPLYDAQGVASTFNERCTGVRAAHDAVIASRPDLIIWHDLQSVLSRRSADGTLLVAGSPAWTDDLVAEWQSVLERLRSTGAEVAIIVPPLRSQDAPGCEGSPLLERCREIQEQDRIIRDATSSLWDRIQDTPRVHLLELDPLLCPAGYPCPGTIDGIDVRIPDWDQTHFTDAGAAWFAPRLLDAAMAAVASGA